MSGVVRGVRKAFRKVGDVVKSAGPAVLAVAAVAFTGGSALGLSAAQGGFGAAVSNAVSSIGLTGTLGSVLTGAITQAGYGAVIGGGVSLLTGGDLKDGLKAGAVAGAVTGGISGVLAGPSSASTTSSQPEGDADFSAPGSSSIDSVGGTASSTGAGGSIGGLVPAAPARAAAPSVGRVAASSGGGTVGLGSGGARGVLSGVGEFVRNNQTLVGSAVVGLGQGLLAESETEAAQKAFERRRRIQNASFEGVDLTADYASLSNASPSPSPAERFQPRSFQRREYRYDEKTNRIRLMPAEDVA